MRKTTSDTFLINRHIQKNSSKIFGSVSYTRARDIDQNRIFKDREKKTKRARFLILLFGMHYERSSAHLQYRSVHRMCS